MKPLKEWCKTEYSRKITLDLHEDDTESSREVLFDLREALTAPGNNVEEFVLHSCAIDLGSGDLLLRPVL